MFFGSGKAVFKFKLVQEVDSRHIPFELFLCTAHAEGIVGNTVVVLLTIGNFGVRVIHGKRWLRLWSFHHFGNDHIVLLLVFLDLRVLDYHKLVEGEVGKLVIVQLLQRAVLTNLDKIFAKIFFNLVFRKIDGDLHEKFLVLGCCMGKRNFGKVVDLCIVVAVLTGIEILDKLLCAFKLVNDLGGSFLSCRGYVAVLKDGYREVGIDELFKVLIDYVIRDTAHRDTVVITADRSARQSKVKHVCDLYGIVTEELVKVTHAHHCDMLRIRFLGFLVAAQNGVL